MTDRDAIYTRVLEDPTDDTVRLVLADQLRESDGPDELARGRFLWAGVTASRFRDHDLIEDSLYYTAQQEIDAVSGAGYPALWLSALGLGPQPLTAGDWAWDCTLDRVTVRIGAAVGTFTRGLLAELSVTLGEWSAVAPAVLAHWPLELASATDVPGLTFEVRTIEGKWRLVGRLRVPRRRVPLGGGVLPAAVAPLPFLTETAGDWHLSEDFPSRGALVAAINSASARQVDDLCEAAGDRWPSPPRKRR